MKSSATRLVHRSIGMVLAGQALLRSGRRDQRGLSQSTENAVLLLGAVTIATGVITAVTLYVKNKMPK